MKYGIVVFPGSNCDKDTFYAINTIMGDSAEYIWHESTSLSAFDCIILPGGFSYGDYLRAGAIAQFSPVMKSIIDFAVSGGLVLGICNGFQVLLEAGLLPGAMLHNRNLHFISKEVHLKVENNQTAFSNAIDSSAVLKMFIAHQEGNYYCDNAVYQTLVDQQQIMFRYSSPEGDVSDQYNPNGSIHNIAGICNKDKNVFGLMPHPERAVEAILGSEDGKVIFESLKNYKS